MTEFYDDNFGHWDMGSDGDSDAGERIAFYHKVQRESVMKKCEQCGRMVRLRPDYAICGRCADAIERGMDY